MRCFLVRSVGKLGVNYLNTQEEYGKLSHYHLEVMKANEKKVCDPKQLWNQRGQCGKDQSRDNFKLKMGKNVYNNLPYFVHTLSYT